MAALDHGQGRGPVARWRWVSLLLAVLIVTLGACKSKSNIVKICREEGTLCEFPPSPQGSTNVLGRCKKVECRPGSGSMPPCFICASAN